MTFLRPLSEMNNGNNPYAPYNHSGRLVARTRQSRCGQLIKAWRRIALITRGAGRLRPWTRTLRRLDMPPVRTARAELPRSAGGADVGAALVRQPRDSRRTIPAISGREPATSTGSAPPGTRQYKASSAMDRFYSYLLWRAQAVRVHRVGHLGPRRPRHSSGSSLSFLKLRTARVRMAVYYQSALLKREFRLSTHPLSARGTAPGALRWRATDRDPARFYAALGRAQGAGAAGVQSPDEGARPPGSRTGCPSLP